MKRKTHVPWYVKLVEILFYPNCPNGKLGKMGKMGKMCKTNKTRKARVV